MYGKYFPPPKKTHNKQTSQHNHQTNKQKYPTDIHRDFYIIDNLQNCENSREHITLRCTTP